MYRSISSEVHRTPISNSAARGRIRDEPKLQRTGLSNEKRATLSGIVYRWGGGGVVGGGVLGKVSGESGDEPGEAL